MVAELTPTDEPGRLAALRRYDILDSPPDGAFDRITAVAARLFGAPIAIVSLVDTDRIWFKSHHGIDAEQVDREPGLCASAILQDDPWVVTDASTDPRTLANPLVAGSLGLRFYAGVPLRTHDGFNLGTLCVIDHAPRQVSPSEVAILGDLASVVMDEMELRLSARHSIALESALRRSAEETARVLQEGLLPSELPEVAGLAIAARYHVADDGEVGGDFYDVVPTENGCVAFVGDACGKGIGAATLTGRARWALRTLALAGDTPAHMLDRLNCVLVGDETRGPRRYCTVALAGQPAPLVVRAAGVLESVGRSSPIVGWRAGACYDDVELTLRPGDVLVLYTDGLVEAIAGHGSGDDAPLRAVLRPLAGEPPEVVAARLDAALGVRPWSDDAAYLVVGVR